jgi:hypothetical protein
LLGFRSRHCIRALGYRQTLVCARERQKFACKWSHPERPPDKLPFLLLIVGNSNVIKKIASHLAQPCG